MCALFFSSSLHSVLLTYDTRIRLDMGVVDFFLYSTFISKRRSQNKKERRARFLFYSEADVFKLAHQSECQTRTYAYTWQNYLQMFRHFIFLISLLLLHFHICQLMSLWERESQCTVDFDFWSHLVYVCHHNLSFAFCTLTSRRDKHARSLTHSHTHTFDWQIKDLILRNSFYAYAL